MQNIFSQGLNIDTETKIDTDLSKPIINEKVQECALYIMRSILYAADRQVPRYAH
jgi:hypothetical protein